MIAIHSLGQTDAITTNKRTAYRPMALQYARSAVLKAAQDLTPFPGRIVELAAQRFNALVNLVVETANQPGWATNPGYTWRPAFTEAEAAKALTGVGYRSGLAAEVPEVITAEGASAAPVYQLPRLPQPDTTRQIFVALPGIQPVPSPQPIMPEPVIPSPVPVPVVAYVPEILPAPSWQPVVSPLTPESVLRQPEAKEKEGGNVLAWAAAVVIVGVLMTRGKRRETSGGRT